MPCGGGTVRFNRHRLWLAATVTAALSIAGGAIAVAPAATAQATGCRVTYTVANQWPGGFTGNATVENLGSPVNGWQLAWSFTAGQTIDQLWNGTLGQAGPPVTVTNAGWNATIATGGSVSFGFNGSWNNSTNPVPASFALNGVTCTGDTSEPPPTTPPPTTPPPTTPPPDTNQLPSSFSWSSSGILAGPKSDSRNLAAIKDPSVVFHDGRYHLFASTAKSEGYNLVYLNFTDWSQANSATHHYLDQSAIGTGYRAALQVFFFAPQNLWYLVYQTGNASYSTTPTSATRTAGARRGTSTAGCRTSSGTTSAAGSGSTCGSPATAPTASCSPPTTTATCTGPRPRWRTSRTG
jgi:endo-1,4-beta-xylanase